MRMIGAVATIAAYMATSSLPTALANDGSSAFIFDSDTRYISFILNPRAKVAVIDEVSDGCWLTTREAKTAVEVELLRSGIVIDDDDSLSSTIFLYGIGYKTDYGACFVSIDLSIYAYDFVEITHEPYSISSIFSREMASFGAVLSGAQSTMSGRIKDKFIELSKELIVDMNNEKRSTLRKLYDSENTNATNYWISVLE